MDAWLPLQGAIYYSLERDYIGDSIAADVLEIVLEIHLSSVAHNDRCGLQKKDGSPIRSPTLPPTH
jgi:hypothetical protein